MNDIVFIKMKSSSANEKRIESNHGTIERITLAAAAALRPAHYYLVILVYIKMY